VPANPSAPIFLLIGAALFNGGGNAGALATNERLYRLAPPQSRVHCQSRFVGMTSGSVGAGALVCAAALVAAPGAWAVYTALYAGSGISRAIATFRTEVSPSWHSPSAPQAPPAEPELPDAPDAQSLLDSRPSPL
jgi:hypothetical protein